VNKSSLESFIAIAQEKSFSRAAEKLHVTQPAISKRIATLEHSLGTPLFDRIGKEARLTASGKILLTHATEILSLMDGCKIAIQNLGEKIIGELHIGVSHHIGLHRLPPYLEKYSRLYPDVLLKIRFVDSEQAYQLILNGELEIALITLSPSELPKIQSALLWRDPLAFVVNGTHPLATRIETRPIELEELTHHQAILPGADTFTGQLVSNLFLQRELAITSHIETNYLETIRMMVSVGLGWSLLPRTMLDNRLQGIPVNTNPLFRNLGHIRHEDKTASNASLAMIKILQENL
jgi:DNA-binding transcriptional LysR family regulator